MFMKTISVVVATYNRGKLLVNCIKSLMKQSYPKNKYDIIIVNDGSTDSTIEDIKYFVKKWKKIRIITHKKNMGEAASRNTGIKSSHGEIIAFLDDDCIADKNWLSSISTAFVEGIDGVEGRTITKEKKGPFDNYVENLSGGKYMTCNMSYRSSIIKKIECDDRLKYPNRVDSDLAFSVIERGGKIVFEKNAVAEHAVIKGSFLSKMRKKRFFMNDVLLYKKHPVLYRKHIKFPFERFTPFYIGFALLSFVNIFMLAGTLFAALTEMLYRKWTFRFDDFVKFFILQSIGSFVIIGSVVYGIWKFRSV